LQHAQRAKSDDVKSMEQWLHEALQANQRLASAHYLLAQWYEHPRNYQGNNQPANTTQAIRHYHAFVALSPTSPQVAQAERRIAYLVSQVLKAEAKSNSTQSNS